MINAIKHLKPQKRRKIVEFIVRNQMIKEEINLLNAEMCQVMGWDYRPPRGFTNPLDERKKRGKGATAKAPTADKLPEAGVTTE